MSILPLIRRLARVGATDRAWATFVDAGLEGDTTNERALTLKGRLLKDRALALGPEAAADRQALLRAAAQAYSDAAQLTSDSYPRINAAALVHLRGDRATAAMLAQDLLALIDNGQHGGETPYWLEATRAEALLLCGRVSEAQASLTKAVALAPQAREDRAITLRQFRRLLAVQEADAAWLDGFALPPVMHFRGPMALLPGRGDADVIEAVRDIAPGVAFGALAAGTDIVAAETALALGAELHVVLPCGVEAFRIGSVLPFNADWSGRFDALLAQAASIECLEEDGGLTDASVRMADDMAMGLAGIEAQAADDVPVLLRARWAGGGAMPVLGAPHRHVLIDLPRPEAAPVATLPGPADPLLLLGRQGEAAVETIALQDIGQLQGRMRPGDNVDAVVAAHGPLEQPSARMAAMQRLDNHLTILVSRPAALLLWAHCPGCHPVLAGSATSPQGPFELYDIVCNGG